MYTLALHAVHTALGARFEEQHGWNVPMACGDPIAEHHAARTSVGLIDVSDGGKLRALGPDVAGVLHGILTNEIRHLACNRGCLAALLNDLGRMRSLLAVLRTPEGFLLETPPHLASRTRDLIDTYIITEDATIEDVTATMSILSLQGPASARLITDLVVDNACANVVATERTDPPEFSHAKATLVNGVEVRVVRRTRTGEDGYDLLLDNKDCVPCWELLHERVVSAGGCAVGRAALDVLRVEAGIPSYGTDIEDATIPLEAGLCEAISHEKGCYLGQEVIARLTHLSKPVRRLVTLLPTAAVAPGAKVLFEDQDAGRITSIATSPLAGGPVALAYVRTRVLSRGPSTLTVEGAPATLLPGPFYRAASAPRAEIPPSPPRPKGLGLSTLP